MKYDINPYTVPPIDLYLDIRTPVWNVALVQCKQDEACWRRRCCLRRCRQITSHGITVKLTSITVQISVQQRAHLFPHVTEELFSFSGNQRSAYSSGQFSEIYLPFSYEELSVIWNCLHWKFSTNYFLFQFIFKSSSLNISFSGYLRCWNCSAVVWFWCFAGYT